MNKMNRWLVAAGLLGLALAARAGVIIYNQALVNETALAYNNTYLLDIQNVGINSISAAAVYSSATIQTATFTDGSESTGSVTVSNFQNLVAARATNQVTIATTTGLGRATLSLPGLVLREGTDWSANGTKAQTAASLAKALNGQLHISAVAVGTIIYATAPVGSNYNSLQTVSSVPSALTVANASFVGGLDNAILTINGIQLIQGTAFTAATSNNATASSISSAINANATLSKYITASPSGAVVSLTSKINGTAANFGMSSSIPSAMSVSGAAMINGTNPAATLGSAVLRVPNHGLTLALPVLYGANGGVLGGLTDQTTYYAIPVDPLNLKLASSKVNALLGSGISITSTSTQVTSHHFTLSPLPISGTPSFKWEVSNDNVFWNDLAVSSVTINAYTNPSASTIWSFGYIGTRYLRLNVVAPTTGGLALNVRVIGTN